jgi:putative hydrolase of the HAD superfamily
MKLLLLDLDDTLVDDRSAVQAAFGAFVEFHALKGAVDLLKRWQEISRRHWACFERGETTFQEQRRARVREFLGQSFSDADADAAFEPFWRTYQSTLRVFPDVPDFLARTASLTKVVLTNGEREQQRTKVEMVGLGPHIREVITPMDCGAWKPDPRIFLEALGRYEASPSECAMIGDDELRDIQPALRLGMQAFGVDARDPARTLLQALDALRL